MINGAAFINTSFGPGAMVRFKGRKSHSWTYAIYRGVERNEKNQVTAYMFSDLPLGPITLWLAYWPEFIETAVTKRGAE